MSLHLTRKLYYLFGWEYPERIDERQKHLKYLVGEQIKKSHLKLKKIHTEEVKEEFIPVKHSINHYTNCLTGNKKKRKK